MPSSKRAPRSDGEATRARLLESAGALFAAHGYGETTNKAIAAHAGADLASINYHFGGRDGLYRCVLIEAHRRFVRLERLEAIAALELPPAQKLRAVLDLLSVNLGNTRHWSARVLARELASPSSHFEVLRQEEIPPKLHLVLTMISEITNIPLGEPALMHCFISTAAPCAMLILSGGQWLGDDFAEPARNVPVDHLHRFAMAGLEAAAKHYAAISARPPSKIRR